MCSVELTVLSACCACSTSNLGYGVNVGEIGRAWSVLNVTKVSDESALDIAVDPKNASTVWCVQHALSPAGAPVSCSTGPLPLLCRILGSPSGSGSCSGSKLFGGQLLQWNGASFAQVPAVSIGGYRLTGGCMGAAGRQQVGGSRWAAAGGHSSS